MGGASFIASRQRMEALQHHGQAKIGGQGMWKYKSWKKAQMAVVFHNLRLKGWEEL